MGRRTAVCIAVVASVALGGCWSQFRNDPSHQGDNTREAALSPVTAFALTPAWTATPGSGAASSVTVFQPRAYVGSLDGSFVAYASTDGTVQWTAALAGAVHSTAAAGTNLVWVGTDGGNVYGLHAADGTQAWKASVGGAVTSSPTPSGNAVYVGSADHSLYAFDATSGTVLWHYATGAAVGSSPAVVNGVVYVGSADGAVYALNASSGALVWRYATGGAVGSSPAVANGVVYVGSDDGCVYALNASSGALLWKHPTGGAVSSSPAVANGVVYVGSADGAVYALNASSGALVWRYATGAAVGSSPAVANGVVYAGSDAGTITALDATNAEVLWSAAVAGPASSPAVADGMLFVTDAGRSVHAYRLPAACAEALSRIACENSFPGTPQSQWDVTGNGDPSIQGFATAMSVDHGQTVHFKVETDASSYHIDIYRIGYYGGDGARLVTTVRPSVALPQTQPACLTDATTHLIDCGNWAESASWAVPPNATSGVYIARLVRDDTQGASHVAFVVRDDEDRTDLLYQTSDTTWQAYNDWGGYSLYTGPAATAVSYNRPFTTRTIANGAGAQTWLFGAEYPMIRWLESNGYDVSYSTGSDTERSPSQLLQHKVFLSVGHDEYVSAGQRAAIAAARDAGVNVALFSGNTGYWKIRWQPSIDGTSTPYRTIVCYKESAANAKTDPSTVWTGLWRDPRFSPPSDGGRPENMLDGSITGRQGTTALTVTAEEGKFRLWRDTGLSALPAGGTATLAANTVGYEFDFDLDNDARPPGVADLSTTVFKGTTHHLTLYRASSGALVFAAGTIQWSWGLDGHHDAGGSTPDPRMQQATVNLLADMHVAPHTLQPGLVAETASTDTTPPTVTITSTSTTVPIGSSATVQGAASDVGGQVAGVEVSVDGGSTWHPARGRANWSYTWNPSAVGAVTVEARAVDDSANLGAATSATGPTVVARSCPCGLWDASVQPAVPDDGSTTPAEVGVKFRSDTAGWVTGIRFWKSSANTGTHLAHLWTLGGTLLGTATSTGESASGWQQVQFASPIPITAGTTYVASYYAPAGHVARDFLYFDDWYSSYTRGLDVPPLHALWSRDPDGPNGVIHAGSPGFPSATETLLWETNENYWVDVVFTTSPGASPLAPSVPRSPSGTTDPRTGNRIHNLVLRELSLL